MYIRSLKERKVLVSSVWLFVTPWTVAHQAPLSMEFSRQEYKRGLPFSSPGNLPDPEIEPQFPALQADSTDRATREDLIRSICNSNEGK